MKWSRGNDQVIFLFVPSYNLSDLIHTTITVVTRLVKTISFLSHQEIQGIHPFLKLKYKFRKDKDNTVQNEARIRYTVGVNPETKALIRIISNAC